MKSVSFYLVSLAILSFLAGCGKNNESGKKSSYSYNNPYCTTGMNCSPYTGTIGAYNSPYAIANTAQAENPCVGGTQYGDQRIPIQTQVNVGAGAIATGSIDPGVTSYGDVAVLIGNGTNSPVVHAYLCPRVASSGQGTVTKPVLGVYSNCPNVNPITAMDIVLPDGQVAKFRDPKYGVINPFNGQFVRKFSFCQ